MTTPTTEAEPTDAPTTDGTARPAASLPRCDALSPLRADDAVTAVRPAGTPTMAERAAIEARPGFDNQWTDIEAGWRHTVGVTTEVAEWQGWLDDEFPERGIVAVAMPHSDHELDRLVQELREHLGARVGKDWSISRPLDLGVVAVSLHVLTNEALALLEPFATAPICVRGIAPEDTIPPGPQLDTGDGWRLLGRADVGFAYRTGVATNQEQYDALWAYVGMPGPAPTVDLHDHIVVWFGDVYGSSCPDARLDAVIIDADRLFATIVDPTNPVGCTDDANPRAWFVAVERAVLPAPPFRVHVGAEGPPAGAPEQVLEIGADLRLPAATVGERDVRYPLIEEDRIERSLEPVDGLYPMPVWPPQG
ncbi:MAG: hypothetical protein AAGA90_23505 [Actinomycetota bacterium]